MTVSSQSFTFSENLPTVLTKEQEQIVSSYRSKIDHNNPLSIIMVDEDVTSELSEFNNRVLSSVKMTEIKDLKDVIATIRDGAITMDPKIIDQKPGFISRIFGHVKEGIEKYQEKYDDVNQRFDKIQEEIKQNIKDSKDQFSSIEELYDINANQYKKLELVIVACKRELDEMNTVHLPELVRAAESKDPGSLQLLQDYRSKIRTMEKKIYNLETSRINCFQVARAITIARDNIINNIIASVTLIVHGIDEWKRDVYMVINNYNAGRVADNINQMNDVRDLIKRRSMDLFEEATIKTTIASERPSTSIETLQYVNEKFISTIDAQRKIIEKADQDRQENMKKLRQLEEDLKKSIN